EAPSDEEHQSITSVGLTAATLRFCEEQPKHKLFIAGHTDTTASVEFNQPLSEERAKCVLALLEGDRDGFVQLVEKRHTVSDFKQIVAWCSHAFPTLFDCVPGSIDDNAFTGIAPLKRFQSDYIASKIALGAA